MTIPGDADPGVRAAQDALDKIVSGFRPESGINSTDLRKLIAALQNMLAAVERWEARHVHGADGSA